MFGKRVQAEALILDDEGAGHVTGTDFHGVHWDHHVTVSFDPESHKTEIHIEGDPGTTRSSSARAASRSARPGRGAAERAPAPAAWGVVHHIADDEPRWNVPATCPECGARVDQSTAAFAEHPVYTYCAKPLPREPACSEDY